MYGPHRVAGGKRRRFNFYTYGRCLDANKNWVQFLSLSLPFFSICENR